MDEDPIEGTLPAPASTQPVPTEPTTASDLSAQVERAVDRDPLDWVRCVRVFGDFYRCNWWSRKGQKRAGQDFDWGGLITDHVRKSCFLRVTTKKGQLVMEEVRQSTSIHRASALSGVTPEPRAT